MREDVLRLANNLSAHPLAPMPPPPVFEPMAPAAKELGVNGHSAHTATLELPEPPVESPKAPLVEEEPVAPHEAAIESLVRPLIESAPSPPVEIREPALEQPAAEPVPPAGLSEAMELEAALLLDTMAHRMEAEQSEIRSIVTSFQQQAKTALLAAPRQVVTAPAPPSLQWIRTPRPRIATVPPQKLQAADLMFGLQTAPLAGPCIPHDLRNLAETQHPARRGQGRKKAGLPAWTVSFLVAITLFLGVGSLLQYWASNRDTKPSASTPASSAGQSVAAPVVETSSSNIVEVTGLRVLAGPKQPRLDFIVVNHSAAQLSGVGLKIAVRSTSASPLFTISTTIASLGPYQSREFRAELDPGLRASDIPDWQSLRADVRVAAQ